MTRTMAPQPDNASRSSAPRRIWDTVSKSSSGPYRCKVEKRVEFGEKRWVSYSLDGLLGCMMAKLTRSGSQRPSAIPKSLSAAVPLTTKSFAKLRHPTTSDAAMKGSSFELIPAMTGSMK